MYSKCTLHTYLSVLIKRDLSFLISHNRVSNYTVVVWWDYHHLSGSIYHFLVVLKTFKNLSNENMYPLHLVEITMLVLIELK